MNTSHWILNHSWKIYFNSVFYFSFTFFFTLFLFCFYANKKEKKNWSFALFSLQVRTGSFSIRKRLTLKMKNHWIPTNIAFIHSPISFLTRFSNPISSHLWTLNRPLHALLFLLPCIHLSAFCIISPKFKGMEQKNQFVVLFPENFAVTKKFCYKK